MYRYSLTEDTDGERMTDAIHYIFLELPNCKKALTPEATVLDNFCYSLHNMQFLEKRPPQLRQEIFELLFEAANIATFAPEEKTKYDYDMTTERDIRNQIRYAEKKGKAEQSLEIARRMLKKGLDTNDIAEYTGLTEEQIKAL